MTRFANFTLLFVVPIYIVLCVLSVGASIKKTARDIPADLELATFDELISLLPTDRDGAWDSTWSEYICVPPVKELKRRLDTGSKLTDTQWRAALINSHAIRVRRLWPAQTPFAVYMRLPAWCYSIELDPISKGLAKASVEPISGCFTAVLGSIESDAYQEIGRLPVGRHQLEFNVTVKSGETPRRRIVVGGRKRPPELPQILWQGPISFTVDVVDDIDNVIPAVSGIEITEAVRQSLHPSINNSEGGLGTSIQISPPPKLFEKFKNTAISLKVEFRREERAVETIEYDAVCVDSEILESPSISWDTGRDPLLEIPQNLLEDENAQRDWDIRITGTNKGILHFWDAERRWNGEIVVPLREVLKKKL